METDLEPRLSAGEYTGGLQRPLCALRKLRRLSVMMTIQLGGSGFFPAISHQEGRSFLVGRCVRIDRGLGTCHTEAAESEAPGTRTGFKVLPLRMSSSAWFAFLKG